MISTDILVLSPSLESYSMSLSRVATGTSALCIQMPASFTLGAPHQRGRHRLPRQKYACPPLVFRPWLNLAPSVGTPERAGRRIVGAAVGGASRAGPPPA